MFRAWRGASNDSRARAVLVGLAGEALDGARFAAAAGENHVQLFALGAATGERLSRGHVNERLRWGRGDAAAASAAAAARSSAAQRACCCQRQRGGHARHGRGRRSVRGRHGCERVGCAQRSAKRTTHARPRVPFRATHTGLERSARRSGHFARGRPHLASLARSSPAFSAAWRALAPRPARAWLKLTWRRCRRALPASLSSRCPPACCGRRVAACRCATQRALRVALAARGSPTRKCVWLTR